MKFRQLVFIRSAIPLVNHRIIPNKNPPTFFNLEYLSVGRSLESTESLNRHTVDTVSAHQDHSATELQGAISTPSIHLNPDPWVSTLAELLLRSLFGLDFMQPGPRRRARPPCALRPAQLRSVHPPAPCSCPPTPRARAPPALAPATSAPNTLPSSSRGEAQTQASGGGAMPEPEPQQPDGPV